MADNSTRIVITAEDKTRAALDSVTGNLKGLQGALGGLDGIAGRLPGIGAAVAAAFGTVSFVGAIKGAVDYAGKLNDLSLKTGVSVEALSALRDVAELSDTSLESAGSALQKLTRNMTEAAAGSKEQVANFAALGVAITDSHGALRGAGDVMTDLAGVIASIENPTERVAAAQLALGKSGGELVPLLLDLAERGMSVASITAEQARQADAFGDALAIMKQQVRASGEAFGISLLPAMAAVAEVANGAMAGIKQLGSSLAVVAKDIETGVKIIGYGLGAGFTEEGRKAIRDALDERSRFVEAANEDMADRASKYRSLIDQVLNPPEAKAKAGAPDALAARLKALREEMGKTRASRERTPRAERAPEDYADRVNQAVAGAINNSSVVKSRELAAQIEALDKLFFDAGLDVDIYSSALEKLTGMSAKAGQESTRLNELLAATPTAKIEEAQHDMVLLSDALESGRISEEQYLEAVTTRLDLVADKTQEANDFAREMGLTFSSAFEDAIVDGKSFSEVLQGLAKDIERIVVRKTITEPLGNAISGVINKSGFSFGNLFEGIFGGGRASGGPVSPGQFYVVGERGPEVLVPSSAGTVIPNGALGGAAPITITQNINIDSRSDAATIRMAMIQAKNETLAAIGNAQRRGA